MSTEVTKTIENTVPCIIKPEDALSVARRYVGDFDYAQLEVDESHVLDEKTRIERGFDVLVDHDGDPFVQRSFKIYRENSTVVFYNEYVKGNKDDRSNPPTYKDSSLEEALIYDLELYGMSSGMSTMVNVSTVKTNGKLETTMTLSIGEETNPVDFGNTHFSDEQQRFLAESVGIVL